METKIFIGLGVITIICGIMQALGDNVFIGICGSVVGAWLVVDNVKKLKGKEEG